MLSHDEVVRLNQELAGTKVLSVYLNAEETDPAARRAWRVRLNSMLKALEEGMKDGPEAEQIAARAAVGLVREEVERHTGQLPGRAWVGFATADRLWYIDSLPTPMPDLARWEDGAHVAPYLRAMKQARPVTAVVADRRHARIYRYANGELREEAEFWSDTATADSTSGGSSKRSGTHSGVRGESRGDAAKRVEQASAQRMVREVLEALSEPARDGHLLVLAGNSETTTALLRALPERARERAMEASGTLADATPAELKDAVETAASALSVRLQHALVEQVIDATRSAGRACLGREHTERALQAGAVETLILSRAFARAEPGVAERIVDHAFEQGAVVEEISEAAAAELDREGGIGARLRFAA
jgi:hypothetical protein